MVGGRVSVTVKVVEQVEELSAVSWTVRVIKCVPGPTGVPATGL